MTAARDRKEAAKRLGCVLAGQKARLDAANGTDAISLAAMELGETFNDNIEFICWVLKEYGGIEQLPFARQNKPAIIGVDLASGPDRCGVWPTGQDLN